MTEPTRDTVSPWQPMQDKQDLKVLGKLLEELGELTSATSRCLIQGIDETEPMTGKPNRQWLEEEVADVLACLDILLMQFPVNGMALQLRTERKVERLKAWLALT